MRKMKDNFQVKPPFFFSVENKNFLFDSATNYVLQLPKTDSRTVKEIFSKESNTENLIKALHSSSLKAMNSGFFQVLGALVEKGGFFSQMELMSEEATVENVRESVLRNGLYELLLDVTHDCNFRCRYCSFSGNYDVFRTHTHQHMDSETAFRAVELYFSYIEEGSLVNPLREPTIGFYGGEPLLNFSLIKEIVEYVTQKYSNDYDIQYTLTTNGSLLTDEVINFLLDHNFIILISIDGPKSEHNRNRIFPDGSGTFDIIMKNVERLTKSAASRNDSSIHSRMFALVTYDIKTDLLKVKEFFDNQISLIPIFINPVRPYDTEYYSQFSEEDKSKFDENIAKLNELYLKGVAENRIEDCSLFQESLLGLSAAMGFYRALFSRTACIDYSGSCLPGFKIHVDIHGEIRPCEKCPTELVIGNVSEGVVWETVAAIINDFKNQALSKCSSCSVSFNCSACMAILGVGGSNQVCADIKATALACINRGFHIHLLNSEYLDSRLDVYTRALGLADLK
jgi:uncharacterized protein